jgi:carboxyl-terminal processing protease
MYSMSKKKKLRRVVKVAGITGLALGIFIFGVAVGNHTINFSTPSSENKQLSKNIDYSSVNQLYQLIKNDYDGQLTNSQILDGLKSGLAKSTGDPYTEYFNPDQAKQFNNLLTESFTGIGAALDQDASNNIVVITPIAGFPADKAGLMTKDVITSIDGASTTDMPLDTAIAKIRGPKGTIVTLGILRNSNQQLSLKITRDNIKVPSVTTKIIDNKIGYMEINQFTDDTTSLATAAAQQFKQQGVKGLILDLRNNPGGLVVPAVNVSSLWLPNGKTVYQEKRGSQVISTSYSDGSDILGGIPTIVLINAESASASEITAAALHDNGVATLLGEKSYGKGVVQQEENLPDGSLLKVTIAKWYRPNNQNIDKVGITPDKIVIMTDADFKNGLDPQKDAALTILEQK